MRTVWLVIYDGTRETWCSEHDDMTAAWRQYRELKTKLADERYGSLRIARLIEATTPDEERRR